jgi:hypothetical protein
VLACLGAIEFLVGHKGQMMQIEGNEDGCRPATSKIFIYVRHTRCSAFFLRTGCDIQRRIENGNFSTLPMVAFDDSDRFNSRIPGRNTINEELGLIDCFSFITQRKAS